MMCLNRVSSRVRSANRQLDRTGAKTKASAKLAVIVLSGVGLMAGPATPSLACLQDDATQAQSNQQTVSPDRKGRTSKAAQVTTDADRGRAERLVQEALMHEVYGDRDARNALLTEALDLDPANPQARWHSGYVLFQKEWVNREEIRDKYAEDRSIKAYLQRRESADDSATGQLELANWCRQNDLINQERAHLSRVIQLDPNHEVARARLGFQRDPNGKWIAAEEIQAANELQRSNAELFAEWRSTVSSIGERLSADRPELRQRAEKELLSILDPDAIPAIEVILSNHPEHVYLAIQTISRMKGLQAANSLARHAVFAAQDDARRLAAMELKSRDKLDYVPDLLGEMVTPIRSIEQLIPGQGRRLIHRTAWVREDQDAEYVTINDEAYRRGVPTGNGQETLGRTLTNVGQRSRIRNAGLQMQNLQTEELNRRICETLATATGENLPPQPQAWWDWWNQDNDILIEGTKQQIVAYDYRETVVSDNPYSMPTPQSSSPQTPVQTQTPRTCECLPRGTQVWTASGPAAIESIQVGDLVLAQDIKSGELTYAPVLRTTRRPPGPLVRIECYDQTIRASQGHPFWVSGSGWVKACDLESGMELHTTDGTLRISDVSQSEAEETFNLVVDRHASYFVGKHRVLSHDHTLPQATEQIVPGLAE